MKIELIDNSDSLSNICNYILNKNIDVIALDTEFCHSVNSYFPKISIIQFTVDSQNIFVVDVLSEKINISILESILCKKSIIKIFHDCKQDILALHKIMNNPILPLFDTQIAFSLSQYSENSIGYVNLVKNYNMQDLGDMKKKFKRTNWLERPLSKEQLNYAAIDTVYLIDIYNKLQVLLKSQKRLYWLQEEVQAIMNKLLYPEQFYNKIFGDSLIQKILSYREILATEYNIKKENIIDSKAVKYITNLRSLEDVKNFLLYNTSTLFKRNFEDKILEFIINSTHNKIFLTKYFKSEKTTDSLVSLLSGYIDLECIKIDISPHLIYSKDSLRTFINYGIGRLAQGWQNELFGKNIRDFLKEKNELNINIQNICNNR